MNWVNMGKTIDLTKVNLEPKAIAYLSLAFAVVLLAYSIGQWGSVKLKDILKSGAGAASASAEEF